MRWLGWMSWMGCLLLAYACWLAPELGVCCLLVLIKGAFQPVCTSCEKPHSVSLRPAQWATLPSAREKFNQNRNKTALTGCFGPVLIEFRKQSPHIYIRITDVWCNLEAVTSSGVLTIRWWHPKTHGETDYETGVTQLTCTRSFVTDQIVVSSAYLKTSNKVCLLSDEWTP